MSALWKQGWAVPVGNTMWSIWLRRRMLHRKYGDNASIFVPQSSPVDGKRQLSKYLNSKNCNLWFKVFLLPLSVSQNRSILTSGKRPRLWKLPFGGFWILMIINLNNGCSKTNCRCNRNSKQMQDFYKIVSFRLRWPKLLVFCPGSGSYLKLLKEIMFYLIHSAALCE